MLTIVETTAIFDYDNDNRVMVMTLRGIFILVTFLGHDFSILWYTSIYLGF